MGLKIATFQYVNQFGGTENAIMSWAGADINYGSDGSIRFSVFENADEMSRGNRKATFVLPVRRADVNAMFAQVGNVALEISDASWELARTTRFIASRIIDKDTGEPRFEIFSLDDLSAAIVDVGVPEEV